jgi:hypothetical protein
MLTLNQSISQQQQLYNHEIAEILQMLTLNQSISQQQQLYSHKIAEILQMLTLNQSISQQQQLGRLRQTLSLVMSLMTITV